MKGTDPRSQKHSEQIQPRVTFLRHLFLLFLSSFRINLICTATGPPQAKKRLTCVYFLIPNRLLLIFTEMQAASCCPEGEAVIAPAPDTSTSGPLILCVPKTDGISRHQSPGRNLILHLSLASDTVCPRAFFEGHERPAPCRRRRRAA